MASVSCRANSVLQLSSRLSAALQALGHRKGWRSVNLQPQYGLASSATSGEATKNVSVSTGDRLLSKDEDLRQVSTPHAGKKEQVSSDQAIQDDSGLGKARKSWKPASKRDKEDVVRKVLPGLGEAKSVKFRLGKKFITAESARERSPTNEELIESEEGARKAVVDLPKNRAGHYMEVTSELVKAVTKNLSLTKRDQRLYSDALPSVFGTSVGGAKQVAMTLNKAGLTKSDVSTIFPKFPHILDIDYDNVARVYTMLNEEYKMNRLYLVGLLRNHPYVFTMEEGVVRERMDALLELGLRRNDVASLLIHHPLLLSCPLSSETVKVAREALNVGLSSRWLAKSLSYNMHLRPARMKLQNDIRQLVELFEHYNVNMAEALINQPKILTLQAKDAEAVIGVLCSHPLYLNSPDISHLLSRQPDLFKITDIDTLRCHLSLLCEVLGSSENVRYMFRSVRNLLDPSCNIQGKVDLLTGKGFSKQDTFDVISQCPSILTHDTTDELKPKLEIMMQVPGVVPTHLTKSPRSFFLLDIKSLQARYNFAKEHKEKLLKASKLDDIFCSTDKEFAALCGVDVSDYYQWTGFTPLVRRRKKHITNGSKLDDARLELKEAQVSAKDTTPLHDNIITEDETSVGSGVVVSLESELDMERETETEDSLGMRLALGSQGILGDLAVSPFQSEILSEDFDNVLQYNDPTPQQGTIIDKTTLKQSTISPQLYHHDLSQGLHSERISETPSLATETLEATQLSQDLPKTSAKGDNILPHNVPKTSVKRDNVLVKEGAAQRELSGHFSTSVGTELASCNNHNLSYMFNEASQVLPSDSTCTFSSASTTLGSIESMNTAVQLDLQGDSETTAADSGNGDDVSQDEVVGAVDLDSFVSKELADLLQELQKETILKEEGSSSPVVVKGMVRIGEIDGFIEDGLQPDFVEEFLEMDQNTHHLSSSM